MEQQAIRQFIYTFHKQNGHPYPMTKDNLTIVIDGEPKEGLYLSDLFIKVNKTYDNKVKGFSMLQFSQLKHEKNSILYNGIKLEMLNKDGEPVVISSLEDPFLRDSSITLVDEIQMHTDEFTKLLTLELPSLIARHNKFLKEKGYKLIEFIAMKKPFVFAYKKGEEPYIFFQVDNKVQQSDLEQLGEMQGIFHYKTGVDFEILYDTTKEKIIVR